jgi:hypothetical protein
MESRVTAQLMLELGVNNVRGSMFCGTRDYHVGDVDALTKFLGHYNDLDYREVYARLCRTLPTAPDVSSTMSSSSLTSSTSSYRRRRTYGNGNGGGNNYHRHARCYVCGELGHIASSCPKRHEMTLGP